MEPGALTAQRELRGSDLAAVRGQLGREPTTAFVVVVRCTGGHPLVIRNAPLDAGGDPFPTTFWLTCPTVVKAVARIEAAGAIGELNARAGADDDFARALDAAHGAYARERARDLPAARAWGGVAGTRVGVKCLHAHYAYHLVGGDDPVGAWVAARIEPVHPEQGGGRVAAIDQGTNSCRLLVLEPRPEGPTEISRDLVMTRLGEGVDRTGRLDPDAVERTVAVVEGFCRRARALAVERIRVGATSAVRDAENREAFAQAVLRHADAPLELITGEREAALSFLGGTFGLAPSEVPGPYLVQDIGGGSTEFVMGANPGAADAALSTQMGSVRLTERLMRSDPPSPEDLAALDRAVGEVLDHVAGAIPVDDARTFVSVAGTGTTLQAIALGLPRYDPDRIHRSWLARSTVEELLLRLAEMTNEERSALPVMVPGRGDVIVAGAAILANTMRRFGFERALVSETDILDGLAFEMLGVG